MNLQVPVNDALGLIHLWKLLCYYILWLLFNFSWLKLLINLFFPFSLHILWILLCFHSYFSHHVGVQTSISHTHQQLGLPKYPVIDSISGWAWPDRWGHSCFMGSWGCRGCQDSQAIRTKEYDEQVGNLAPGVHGKYFFHGTYGTQPVGFSSYFSQIVFVYQVF